MADLFADGVQYPRRGWERRAQRFGGKGAKGSATTRRCPTCHGNGVYFDELQEGEDVRRPRICRDCPAFLHNRLGER